MVVVLVLLLVLVMEVGEFRLLELVPVLTHSRRVVLEWE
jgi:hypothetical protein